MKNLLLVVVVTFLLLSCEISKVVNYPNVDIKFENNTIFYKSKKYTGKMKIVIKDKGIQASLNVKEGKLNGKGNLKKDFEGEIEYLYFFIKNGKLDKKFIYKSYDNFLKYEYKMGKLKKYKSRGGDGVERNFVFNDKGKANGTIELKELNIRTVLENGTGVISRGELDHGETYKVYIDERGDIMEEYYIDKILDAENKESIMDVKQVEKIVFEILSEQD